MSERDLFVAARGQSDPAARAAFLDTACAGDAALRRRLETLLQAADRPDLLLDLPPAAVLADDPGQTDDFPPSADRDTPAPRSADDDLGFLAPPRRSGYLGRLGHYAIRDVLGRGGFGIVFRAFDEVLRREVAVKVLAPQLAVVPSARRRFLREARSAAAIRHENVVQVHAVEEEPLPYLVMEYVPGETLHQRLRRAGPLDPEEVVRLGRQLATGLAAAHAAGLIHRDVKPANVLLEAATGRVKLTDFGLARAGDDGGISRSGVVAGTPSYMSPEQARGERLDPRSDLFSLGSVLYTMATGQPPFQASTPLVTLRLVSDATPRPLGEINPRVPPWLVDVVAQLHAKDPEQRLPSAQAVADLLASPPSTGGVPPSPPRRFSRVLAALLVAVLALGLVWSRPWDRPEKPRVEPPDIHPTPPSPAVLRAPPATPDDERRAAIWLRSLGPTRLIVVEVNGPEHIVEHTQALPAAPFRLRGIALSGPEVERWGEVLADVVAIQLRGTRPEILELCCSTIPLDGLAKLLAIPEFSELSALGLKDLSVGDALLAHLARLPRLSNLTFSSCRALTGRGIGALAACPDLQLLTVLADTPFAPEALAELAQLPKLAYLNLAMSVRSPRHVEVVSRLRLTHLHLAGWGVDDALAARLAEMTTLQVLGLGANPLTDRGLAEFRRLTNLRECNVMSTGVTPAGVAALRMALPTCNILVDPPADLDPGTDPERRAATWLRSLGPCGLTVVDATGKKHTVEPVQPLPPGSFRLVTISFSGKGAHDLGDRLAEEASRNLHGTRASSIHLNSELLTSVGFGKLAELPELAEVSHLSFMMSRVDDGVFAPLAKLPKLRDLHFANCHFVTGRGVHALRSLANLTNLTALGDTPIVAEALEEMRELPQLKYLNLDKVRWTERHFEALIRLKLTTLIVRGSAIDDALAQRLAEMTTLRTLSITENELTDRTLAAYARLTRLERLVVRKTRVTAKGVAELQRALPECRVEWE